MMNLPGALLSTITALLLFFIPTNSVQDLVEAERSFAKLCGQKGVRESFLAYFADDGMSFSPKPGNAKEQMRARPAPTGPPTAALNWAPAVAELSLAGDMGYTTGPYELSVHKGGSESHSYGQYFSVWKKQTDGSWKVAADFGTVNPKPGNGLDEVKVKADFPVGEASKSGRSMDAVRVQIGKLEGRFEADEKKLGFVKSYAVFLIDHSRLHVNGHEPIVGRHAIVEFLKDSNETRAWHPMKVEAASSGDFAYSYGSYTAANNGKPNDSGYYLHVWKRQQGKWRLVADVSGSDRDQ